MQFLPLYPQPNPLLLLTRPNLRTLIKLQTRLIPIQTTPLQPLPINLEHLLRQLPQQQHTIALVPVTFLDKQILEVNARNTSPGTVVVEVQRHACDGAIGVDDEQGFCEAFGELVGVFGVGGVRVRECAVEGLDSCLDGGGGFFVVGELLDQAQDCGDVWGWCLVT